MENVIGSLAASTLGFIAGNSRGSYAGYKAFQTYHKNKKQMAPTKRKAVTQLTTPAKSRRTSVSSRASSRRSSLLSSSTRSLAGPYVSHRAMPGDAKQGGFKRSGPKTTKLKKKDKKVRITRSFKKKVDAALSKLSPSGYYQERFYNKFKPVDCRQKVQDIGGGTYNGEFGTTGSRLYFFDPIRVLDVASVLYNNKTPIANKGLSDTGNFDSTSFSVEVIKQWVEINIKNNSARNMEIKLWTWELKKPSLLADFGAEWGSALARDASPTDGKINQIGVTADVIGVSPMLCPSMRERFKIEEKIILLEPGKYFKHTIQGPRKMYNFPSFQYNGSGTSSFLNSQAGIKGCHMSITVDNTSTSVIGPGISHRVTDIVDLDGYGILTETIYNYVLRLPEQAGFKLASAVVGSQQPISSRRQTPYVIKIWNDISAAPTPGTVTEVPDENPQNQAVQGV